MYTLYRVQIGDIVDVRDETTGAWFEAKLTKITRNKKQPLLEAKPDPLSDKENDKNEGNSSGSGDAANKSVHEVKVDGKAVHPDDGKVKDDGFTYHVLYEG